jgi:hypothetical protein
VSGPKGRVRNQLKASYKLTGDPVRIACRGKTSCIDRMSQKYKSAIYFDLWYLYLMMTEDMSSH